MAFEEHFKTVLRNVDPFTSIYGQHVAKEQLKSALLTGRHILILGPPGIGKTTLAKNIMQLLPKDSAFVRVQGSPDLTAEDLIGDIDPMKALQFGPLSKEAFSPGKVFKADKGILFFDEVNRCSEKLQNALLQVLEEGNVSIGTYDVPMPSDFIFIGTLNPTDSSTEKLSDAFMDRFDVIEMSYPETDAIETRIVTEASAPVHVSMPEELLKFVVSYIRSLRDPQKLIRMPSVRASIGVYERACSVAYLRGRDTVEALDIADIIVSVLAHRIELKPSLKYAQSAEEFIAESFLKFAKHAGLQVEDTTFSERDEGGDT